MFEETLNHFVEQAGLWFVMIMGFIHAFESDHVVSVSSIISEKNRVKALYSVFIWSVGHCLVLFVAVSFLIFFPVDSLSYIKSISFGFEAIVGLCLLILAFYLIKKSMNAHFHSHDHGDGKEPHLHTHCHVMGNDHRHYHNSFGLGIVHGLAGSASFVAIISSMQKSVFQSYLVIMVFAAGIFSGMCVSCLGIRFLFKQFDRISVKRIKFNYLFMAILNGSVGILMIRNIILK